MSEISHEDRRAIAWITKQGIPYDVAVALSPEDVRKWTLAFQEPEVVHSTKVNGSMIAAATLNHMHPTSIGAVDPYRGGEVQ